MSSVTPDGLATAIRHARRITLTGRMLRRPSGNPLNPARPARSKLMEPPSPRTTAFRAAEPDPADAPAAIGHAEAAQRAAKTCLICGRALKGRQVSACSGACRIEKTRRTRRDLLVARIQAAETALVQAADALRLLREVASDAIVLSIMRAP